MKEMISRVVLVVGLILIMMAVSLAGAILINATQSVVVMMIFIGLCSFVGSYAVERIGL